MNLNEYARVIHEIAVSKGWWEEKDRNFGELIALAHSELSEALEAHREHKPGLYFPDGYKLHSFIVPWDEQQGFKPLGEDRNVKCNECGDIFENHSKHKPEGWAVELVDCIIRTLDTLYEAGIDVDKVINLKIDYNKTRPYKHGGKKY